MSAVGNIVKYYILSNLRRTFVEKILTSRTIMTTPPLSAEEVVEKLKTNPYYGKYADKISELQRINPEELVQRMEMAVPKNSEMKENTVKGRAFSTPMEPKADKDSLMNPSHSKRKALHDIMRTELIMHKSPDEIQKIWEEYHKNKDVIAATIPFEQYYRIDLRSKEFPVFLFPLPRGEGYEYILCQFSGNEVHFTPLISYQAHKENAPECLTLVHLTEMKDKGVVLMRGEYNKDILNATEALCLTNQLQLYYCNPDEKRMKLLERFTKTPDQFQHIDLIAELESLSI